MKITKRQLKKVIRKELLQEQMGANALIKRLYSALDEDNQKIFMSLRPEQQLEFVKAWMKDGAPGGILSE